MKNWIFNFSDKSYLRPDLIFSNWIFIYTIVYFLGFRKYNPLLLLLIGLTSNIILFFIFIIKLKEVKYGFLLLFVNFVIKVIPIYFLRNTTIVKSDIYFSLFYFLIFLIYINILYYIFNLSTAFSMFNSKNIRPDIYSFYINKILNL